MIALVVSVNGQRLGTIGVGEKGVLGAHVSWVGDAGENNDLRLHFGGLDSATDEHVYWPEPPEIHVGDIVSIQVIETDVVDPPIARKTPAQLRQEEREFLTEMEQEHQAQMRQQIEEELPRFRAPWEQTANPDDPDNPADSR